MMLEFIKNRRQTVILSTLLVLVSIFAVSQYNRARRLIYLRDIEYNRVFSELTEYVDDLEISLLKGQVVSTTDQMAKLSADLYSQASAAKANLALLPMDGHALSKTSEFLSQVGEYAHTVSGKMLRGEKMSEKELKTMQELLVYADTLKKSLDETLISMRDGQVSFEKEGLGFRGGKVAMTSELMALEEEFHNYPSLIYDGPFSQHLSLRESVMTRGKAEISEKQARNLAKKFTGKEETSISFVNGKLPAYSIKSNNTTVEFTKNGGILLLLMKDRYTDEEKISVKDASKIAIKFLLENGFNNMRESYYEKQGGSVVINYAYEQDGYTVFPDLVKVKVALDNGEILGFESRGYVMNHTYRNIPEEKITKEEALSNVSSHLDAQEVSHAIIPLEDGSEAPCWQIKGVVANKHFLMYVNTQTGFTEDVQILLESENGTLAV
ncbi:MAG: germination protein YpeB [Clostridia bacterium]|nr:germination protein YpeB [Clostridia bacterium]